MQFSLSIGIKYYNNSKKSPTWKCYIKDSKENISDGSPLYNTVINSSNDTDVYNFDIDIDDTKEQDYTLVVEHINAEYPIDYSEGLFGIDIIQLKINDIDLDSLIHRLGHSYHYCKDAEFYILDQINNDNFSVEFLPRQVDCNVKNYRLLNYRNSNVIGNTPRLVNNRTGEVTNFTGYLITDNGYVIKGKDLFYDATDDIFFIAEQANNENLYVEGDLYLPNYKYQGMGNDHPTIHDVTKYLHRNRLVHHVPNSSFLSLNGRWEFKFSTPLYSWTVDNLLDRSTII